MHAAASFGRRPSDALSAIPVVLATSRRTAPLSVKSGRRERPSLIEWARTPVLPQAGSLGTTRLGLALRRTRVAARGGGAVG
eukprot:6544663-Prymnesium_polylepis.1